MKSIFLLLTAFFVLRACAEIPALVGDGVNDDTVAIQAMLDRGDSLVSLPAPRKEYVISRPLLLGDGQELRLGRFSRIRLADGSDCRMLSNRDPIRGNHGIAVVGGVWDMNNLGQRHNLGALFWMNKTDRRLWLNEAREHVQEQMPKRQDGEGFDYERFSGVCFRFFNVKGLVLRDVTVRNPTTYGMQFWKVSDFRIDGIRFDYAWGNPAKANMDGLHFDGCCSHGRISNLSGCCFDDFVALNATDGCAPSNGPISDIDIDGIMCDYCHSAVRLLSRTPEDSIRRISIRNVHGRYYSYGIGLTYFHRVYPTRGVMDGITISDCRLARADGPADMWQFPAFGAIEIERGVDVGELTIERLWREEGQCPERATVRLAEDATVERLVLRDCVQVNRSSEPMVFLHNRGKVGELVEEGTRVVSAPGENIRCDATTRAEVWDDPWRKIQDMQELVRDVNYPDRGATAPDGAAIAGFADRMLRVYPFTLNADGAREEEVDPYSVGGFPGICLAEYPSIGVRAEATVSPGVGWFRLRYPEDTSRGLVADARFHVAFSEPVTSVERRGNDSIYRFSPGREPIVVKISEHEIPQGGYDFDRAAADVRRAWNRVPDLASFVNVFVGTSGNGHTHPAAARPFGMVQAGPDTGEGTWHYCSGYRYEDKSVLGYSQNHLSGTGCPDLGDIRLMPYAGDVLEPPTSRPIDKRTERAAPGYYSVVQPDDELSVEIAATKRAAIYRIAGDGVRTTRLLVDLSAGANCAKEGWAPVSVSSVSIQTNGCVLSGTFVRDGWIRGRTVAFALETDRPWTSLEQPDPRRPRYVLSFAAGDSRTLLVRVALSMSSAEVAEGNLREEIRDWDFDRVRREARSEWNRLLSRTRIEGDDRTMRNFYTALYHLYLQPCDWSDAGEKAEMTQLSLWDTFRAAHPWYTLFTPEIVVPTVNSLLALAEKEGKLPVMSYGGRYVECMIGNHAVPVVADACLKGFDGIDRARALAAVTNTLLRVHGGDKRKEDWPVLDKYGYYPFDLISSESVSRTLECGYDDWCAARLCEHCGKRDLAEFFERRCRSWQKVFDADSGFMRGKDSKGNWRNPFNPFALGGDEQRANDYTEGNAWQYTWHVLQDPAELVRAMGGPVAFAARLDALFAAPSEAEGMGERIDVSGLIGQYAHGNEPSHHVAYLYQYAGRADRTAEKVREICDRFYAPTPDGLCGNEDCGQMSAWFVFSALGFYPVNPCGGCYVLGAPQIAGATLVLPKGRVLKVRVKNASSANRYVRNVTLNGRPLTAFTLAHNALSAGGEVVFEMTDRPTADR